MKRAQIRGSTPFAITRTSKRTHSEETTATPKSQAAHAKIGTLEACAAYIQGTHSGG